MHQRWPRRHDCVLASCPCTTRWMVCVEFCTTTTPVIVVLAAHTTNPFRIYCTCDGRECKDIGSTARRSTQSWDREVSILLHIDRSLRLIQIRCLMLLLSAPCNSSPLSRRGTLAKTSHASRWVDPNNSVLMQVRNASVRLPAARERGKQQRATYEREGWRRDRRKTAQGSHSHNACIRWIHDDCICPISLVHVLEKKMIVLSAFSTICLRYKEWMISKKQMS